ncbi:hypothetical protein AHAS_Ahas19G0196100 [Arachis hypogaea]
MDRHLDQLRTHLGLPSVENEEQSVSEEKEEEVPESSETSIEKEVVEEEQQTSSMKVLLNQMLSEKEKVEEQESEEDNQGRPYSSEAENCIEEEIIEPSIQKAFDKDNAPTITQPPSLEIKEVKATDNYTEKRIVTKIPRTTFKKRSTTNNPTPDPASKFNPVNNKRKLAEERLRQGTIAESSLPLRSFLLTNWKKRKKVKNNMSS